MSAKATLRTFKNNSKENTMSEKKERSKSVPFIDKIKSSYYLDRKTEERIMEICINRMKKGERPRKSNIVDEAIALLHKKEFE